MNFSDIKAPSRMPIWARLELIDAGVPFRDVIGYVQVTQHCVDLTYFRRHLDGGREVTHITWLSVSREIG